MCIMSTALLTFVLFLNKTSFVWVVRTEDISFLINQIQQANSIATSLPFPQCAVMQCVWPPA